jgi:hypothetical protein
LARFWWFGGAMAKMGKSLRTSDVNVEYVHKVSLITGLCYSKA